MMSNPQTCSSSQADQRRRIEAALAAAGAATRLHHKQLGQSIVVWEDGRVVVVKSEDIEV